MTFLKSFYFPTTQQEESYLLGIRRTSYITYYPFQVFSFKKFEEAKFEPITIFYGGNGSGKSTAINVIANKIGAERFSSFNSTDFFEPYVGMCHYEIDDSELKEKLVIASDAVFDFLFNIRAINDGVDLKREELAEEYQNLKYKKSQEFTSIGDYEGLKKLSEARKTSESGYFKRRSMANVEEQSNGESALRYFETKIDENGIYLLDEPENSLSPENQLKLKKFIEESARFYNCQFIIATHSPFLLSLDHAKIYNLDLDPIRTDKWTYLSNVVTYYNFFREHLSDFEEDSPFMPEYSYDRDRYKYSHQDLMIQNRLIRVGIDDEPFFEYIAASLKNGGEKITLKIYLDNKEPESITKEKVFKAIEEIIERR